MFDNIGGKIKMLAKVIFWIEAIGISVAGIALSIANEMVGFLLIVPIGVLIAWISSWFLYGFGEIIDKLCDIEKNTRGVERKSEAQAKADDARLNKIEKLRSQGLITEDEYKKALANEQQ